MLAVVEDQDPEQHFQTERPNRRSNLVRAEDLPQAISRPTQRSPAVELNCCTSSRTRHGSVLEVLVFR